MTRQNWAETTHPWNRAETTQAETTWLKGNRTETTQGPNGSRTETTRYHQDSSDERSQHMFYAELTKIIPNYHPKLPLI